MFPKFDPSKMDPKLVAELSTVMRELSPEQLSRMQSLMHNMMAGFDVRKDMEEFERALPASFREKMLKLVASNPQAFTPDSASDPIREARLTVLRAVASGSMSPEEAMNALF